MNRFCSISFLMVISPSDNLDLLRECLNSIATQSDPLFNTTIVLNGILKPSIKKEVANFCKIKKGRVCLLINPDTLSFSQALNMGLEKIDSDIISRIDPDDKCSTDRIRRVKEIFEKSDVDVLGSDILEVTSKNNHKFLRPYPKSHEEIKRLMLWNNQIAHSAVSFKTKGVKEIGGYPEVYLQEDYALWLKCLNSGLIFLNDREIFTEMNVDKMILKRSGSQFFASEIRLAKLKLSYKLYPKYKVILSLLIRILYRVLPKIFKVVFYNLSRFKLYSDQ